MRTKRVDCFSYSPGGDAEAHEQDISVLDAVGVELDDVVEIVEEFVAQALDKGLCYVTICSLKTGLTMDEACEAGTETGPDVCDHWDQ